MGLGIKQLIKQKTNIVLKYTNIVLQLEILLLFIKLILAYFVLKKHSYCYLLEHFIKNFELYLNA